MGPDTRGEFCGDKRGVICRILADAKTEGRATDGQREDGLLGARRNRTNRIVRIFRKA